MNQTRESKFTITDAARLLSVSATTVRREIKRRNLGSYRLAGRRLIGESHLSDYLARREQKPQLDERQSNAELIHRRQGAVCSQLA